MAKKSTRGKSKSINAGDLFDEVLDAVDTQEHESRSELSAPGSKRDIRRVQGELRYYPKLNELYRHISRELSTLIVDSSIANQVNYKYTKSETDKAEGNKSKVYSSAAIERRWKDIKTRFDREEKRIKDESNRGSQ